MTLDNDRIQPMVQLSGALAPNPAIIKFPVSVLYALPPAVHHTLVCLSLNHFIHSLPAGANRTAVAAQRSKIYAHRGNAIRALSAYVGKDKTRCSDLAISSILMFMSMEVSDCFALCPRIDLIRIAPKSTHVRLAFAC
jgi:hypothetical protein